MTDRPRISHVPALYITATPIGNLGDITLRALEVLAQAELILAEDTRRTRKLLTFYQIKPKRLIACHDHRPARGKTIDHIRRIIEGGGLAAFVCDSGTPVISDPGFDLARALVNADLPILPLPGASSVTAALSVAALPCHRWSFGGFPPTKQSARRKFLQSFQLEGGALIFFEAARRLNSALEDMIHVFGHQCPAVILREMTKKFEEIKRGSLAELKAFYQRTDAKGENTIILAPPKQS